MAVKVFQVCRVAPRPGSSTASAIQAQGEKLTYEADPTMSEAISQINHALPAQEYLYPPFHRLFFYDILPCSSPADTLLFFHSTIIPKLKTSLSITLQYFLPLTLFVFLKSWTHMCKHVHQSDDIFFLDQLKPFYDRRGVKDPFCLQLEDIYLNQFLNMDRRQNNRMMSDSTRGNFEFTSAKIQTLRKWVMTRTEETTWKQEEGHDRSVHLSTFCLTCAYSWVCLLKAEQEEVKGDIIPMSFSVNCRSRLPSFIPANYFGNCVMGCLALAERKGLLGEDGLVVAVNAITETIKVDDGIWMNGAGKFFNSLYPSDEQTSSSAGHQRLFTNAGSHRFDTSTEVVRINRIGTVTFADGNNGGGAVNVGLVLKKLQMEALLPFLLKFQVSFHLVS
ncbi:phenolic glucoside malonyltransferase 2-like [Pyrus ussuriensis x Pyrus communis]|uniref:Phenolic glucoside malonyltransferase 2-like n=1 Tax=Pyrus ussuriensis x Pyrus communis TaxID=2448454 RepID=A0A5N5GFH5_9ROSA|nr:phenolic glucoside malonyltransferase 2-like [Pyrus ussuriensis x Pyrus communis]